jgi:hypothetical protein
LDRFEDGEAAAERLRDAMKGGGDVDVDDVRKVVDLILSEDSDRELVWDDHDGWVRR